jgi:hypothetical protein
MENIFEEAYHNLSPEERTLVYNRGILASLLDHEFKTNKYTLLSKIKEDPDLFDIQNIKCEKVILAAARNKILEMKSIDSLMLYANELGLIDPEEYKVTSMNSLSN